MRFRNHIRFRRPLIISGLILLHALMVGVALHRLHIETDVTTLMPTGDPVTTDAKQILTDHPMQQKIVVDVRIAEKNVAALTEVGKTVEAAMNESGLFIDVGTKRVAEAFPALVNYIPKHLPVLFNASDLSQEIAPLLTSAHIRKTLSESLEMLGGLSGIGVAKRLEKDPLNFTRLVLSRLSALSPGKKTVFQNGLIFNHDQTAVLIPAVPRGSGTDTAQAKRIAAFFDRLSVETNRRRPGRETKITPVGAYRAALDNERAAKRDMTFAISFSTLVVVLLLVLCFNRPAVGLLAFLPALSGTVISLFILSLISDQISIIALGFGSAIISITIDHGICYLLFLDRDIETTGGAAAREVRTIGMLAAVTSAIAFFSLCFTGINILSQIGRFTALGIAFSFLFIHSVFPLLFPRMPPPSRYRKPYLASRIGGFTAPGSVKISLVTAAGCMVLLPFVFPEFNTDVKSMNTVSAETKAAEGRIAATWGGYENRVLVMVQAKTRNALFHRLDELNGPIETFFSENILSAGLFPTRIFPGPETAERHLRNWSDFWTPGRIKDLKRKMKTAAAGLGFSPGAFSAFWESLGADAGRAKAYTKPPPKSFDELLGVHQSESQTRLLQVTAFTPGSNYNPKAFFKTMHVEPVVSVFDPAYFGEVLGSVLFDLFTRMGVIVPIVVVIILNVYLLWQGAYLLTETALIPLLFGFTATLTVLKLSGKPMDIPGLMLIIVVMGMGIDYALFFVLAYRRYRDEDHPAVAKVRVAVFLAAATTLAGFSGLSFAEHILLRSAGMTSALGIFFTAMGAFWLLPPILRRRFCNPERNDL